MEFINSFIEFAKAVAWPAAIVWLAVHFREHIVAQLPRVTRVGPVSLDPPAQKAVTASATGKDVIKEIEGFITPDLMEEGRKLIELKIPSDARSDKTEEISALRTMASVLLIGGMFEKINSIIFGSQLDLLQLANALPQTTETARTLYDSAVKNFPQTYGDFSFEQWIAFLENSVLLKKEPDGRLHITKRGRGFLGYLVQNGYPTARLN